MFFTLDINHHFICSESKSFWNDAKLQNIMSMTVGIEGT